MKKIVSILFFLLIFFKFSVDFGGSEHSRDKLNRAIGEGYTFEENGQQFKIYNDKIGHGFTASVYRGEILDDHVDVAFKIEFIDNSSVDDSPLTKEFQIYKLMNAIGPENPTEPKPTCVSRIYAFRKNIDLGGVLVNVLVMEIFEQDLMEIVIYLETNFSMETVLMLTIELLEGILYFHLKGIRLNDIKPENIMVGLGKDRGKLKFVDYGGATIGTQLEFVCTLRFGSERVLKMLADGHRHPTTPDDDIFSITASVITLFRGFLKEYSPLKC